MLPIVNRDGRRLIGDNFTFQQDGVTCHTADTSMATIEKLKFSVIPPNKWPANLQILTLWTICRNEVEERLKGQKYPTRAFLVAAIKLKIPLDHKHFNKQLVEIETNTKLFQR